MNLHSRPTSVNPGEAGRNGPVPALVITADTLALRRRIGPLGWVVLEYLALCAQRTERGWASPVGVRDMAGGVGVTKDTAARAVAALGAAGLVTLDRIETPGGRRRSGYRLHLPEHIRRIDGPDSIEAVDGCSAGHGRERRSAATLPARRADRDRWEQARDAGGAPAGRQRDE